MQRVDLCGPKLLVQLAIQQLPEHRVVLIPLLLKVEGNRKHAICFKPAQGRLCFAQVDAGAADGRARRAGDAFKHRGLQ